MKTSAIMFFRGLIIAFIILLGSFGPAVGTEIVWDEDWQVSFTEIWGADPNNWASNAFGADSTTDLQATNLQSGRLVVKSKAMVEGNDTAETSQHTAFTRRFGINEVSEEELDAGEWTLSITGDFVRNGVGPRGIMGEMLLGNPFFLPEASMSFSMTLQYLDESGWVIDSQILGETSMSFTSTFDLINDGTSNWWDASTAAVTQTGMETVFWQNNVSLPSMLPFLSTPIDSYRLVGILETTASIQALGAESDIYVDEEMQFYETTDDLWRDYSESTAQTELRLEMDWNDDSIVGPGSARYGSGYASSDFFDTVSLNIEAVEPAHQPVPEPATVLLFGTGIAGLVGSRIRKKKQK